MNYEDDINDLLNPKPGEIRMMPNDPFDELIDRCKVLDKRYKDMVDKYCSLSERYADLANEVLSMNNKGK